MHLIISPESRLELSRALRLMTDALDILDEVEAPGKIGSTLDLAVVRLEKFLARDRPADLGAQRLISQLQHELGACRAGDERKPSPWDDPPVRQ